MTETESDQPGCRPSEERTPSARDRGGPSGCASSPGPTGSRYAPHDVVTTDGTAAVAVAGRLFPDDSTRGERAEGGRLPAAGWACPTRCASSASCDGPAWSPSRTTCSSPTTAAGAAAARTRRRRGGSAPGRPGCPRVRVARVRVTGVRVARCTRPRVRQPGVRLPRVRVSPVYASPVYASPVYASPVYASAEQATGRRPSSARPAVEPWVEPRLRAARGRPRRRRPRCRWWSSTPDSRCPTSTPPPSAPCCRSCRATAADGDQPDDDADLGPRSRRRARHVHRRSDRAGGTGNAITLRRVLHAEGDGDEVQIAAAIDALPDPPATGGAAEPVLRRLRARGARPAGRRRGAGPGPRLRRGGVRRQRRHVPPHPARVAARGGLGGRRRPARPGALQQLRPVGAGVRARRRPREHVLRRLERRRPGRRPTATPTTTPAGRAGAARRSRRPSWSARSPARWPRARPPPRPSPRSSTTRPCCASPASAR